MAELSKQERIYFLEHKNPLMNRFDIEFFKKIPNTPGVYWMLGEQKALLYIGKAKNLKNRLRSYQQIKADRSPRKLVQLVRLIQEIQWEECESEETALSRESYLLRTFRPPFNTHNIHPETCYLITLRATETHLNFRLTSQSNIQENEEILVTVKRRQLAHRTFASMIRLLWIVLSKRKHETFQFPSVLARKTIPYTYSILINHELPKFEPRLWRIHIFRFLNGFSKTFLCRLTQELLEFQELPTVMYHFIQLDIQTLSDYHALSPQLKKSEIKKLKNP